jgi:hypothetical protein
MRAGGGLGGLRIKGAGASLMAEGAMVDRKGVSVDEGAGGDVFIACRAGGKMTMLRCAGVVAGAHSAAGAEHHRWSKPQPNRDLYLLKTAWVYFCFD